MALVQEPEPGRKLLLEYGGRSIWEAQQLSLAGLGGFTRDTAFQELQVILVAEK
jgi:hypothetical protein